MPAVYSLPISAVAVTAVQDILEILAPSVRSTRLLRVVIDQTGLTASELLRVTIKLVTGAPTSGSGGGTVTPVPPNSLFGSSGLTVERNNTTRISGGTQTIYADKTFNVLAGFDWVASRDEEAPESPGAAYHVIGLETAPSASMNLSGYALVEVFG